MNNIKNNAIIKLSLLVLASVLSLSAYAISEKNLEAIKERTAPVAKVCLEGDDSCGSVVAAVASGPQSAEDVYNASCMACHATGAAGAPKLGDTAAWAPRIAKGLDTLHDHALNGFNGMPPKGLCMSCSDDEIKATVDYIVENSK
ncbi:c-type cytochrome [Dasania marina]|uniref:c-type cytochrome n=1 Tax=Dasania marina TaxID=471499 RepID=UPI0003660730|nr:cytochrome c5 family protein [Dasania marina]